MSVRILLDHLALRLDRDRNDPERVLLRAHRHADIERLFGADGVIDRPDHRYRYRAFVPLERIAWAFGREVMDKLTNANLPQPSPGRQKAYVYADAALAHFKDDRPWPARVPVLRGDWKTVEADSRYEERVLLELSLREQDRAALRLGFRPEAMEDKWFMFFEEPWFYAYRSWTGFPVARFRIGAGIEEAVLNLDPAHTDTEVRAALAFALDGLAYFLGMEVTSEDDVTVQWHAHGHWIVGSNPEAGLDPKRLAEAK